MVSETNQLTAAQVEAATLPAGSKLSTLNDGGGLRLNIDRNGKAWRFRYSHNGRDVLMSFGPYPKVSLAEARAKAAEARTKLGRGESPADARRTDRDQDRIERDKTFGVVAAEYNNTQAHLSAKTRERCARMFRHSKALHGKTFAQIDRPALLQCCRVLKNVGKEETAQRLGIYFAAVFRYARDEGYYKGADPTVGGFGKSLPRTNPEKHRPALTEPADVVGLMRIIDGCEWLLDSGYGSVTATVERALRVLARTAVRPGELANAEWSEMDLDGSRHGGHPTWRIPLRKMKMKDQARGDHIVPLSRQAVEILKAQHTLSGTGRYVFPNARTDTRPMTGEALPAAMIGLGFRDQHCPHGFRTTWKSLCQDVLKAEREIVERQLAHKIGNDVEGAYDRSQRLDERRKLIQDYSDLLDRLRDEGSKGAHP